ncbi:MAG TPA: hypothetical protein VMV44_02640 [Rectinemataceae bacterium]|nr:hypothetical protein [Rectinemataceae bacterium]
MKAKVEPMGASLALLAACAALALATGLASCSSAPKVPDEVFDTRNKAADYLKLADNLVRQGQYDSAEKFYRQAMDADSSVDWLSGTAIAHHSLGRLRLLEGDLSGAEGEFSKAADYARLAGNATDASLAASLAAAGLGEVSFRRGDRVAALSHFEDALRLAGSDERALAVALHDRAGAEHQGGDEGAALADLDRAEAINLRLKRWSELASNEYLRSIILDKRGDLSGAIRLGGEALVNDRKSENSYGIAGDLAWLAELSTKATRADDAYWYWRRSFDTALGANLAGPTLRAVDGILSALDAAGRSAEAADWKAMRGKLEKIAGPGK